MMPDELEALEALAQGATAGPWKWDDNRNLVTVAGMRMRWDRKKRRHVQAADDELSDQRWPAASILADIGECGAGFFLNDADTAYIVAACNAVPSLIARIRELEGAGSAIRGSAPGPRAW